VGRRFPESSEVFKNGPVARFAFGLGFATAPHAEPTRNLGPVLASTPEYQRIRLMGGTDIEDRLSLPRLSMHRIHDHELRAGSQVFLDQAQHPRVGGVTHPFVRRDISRESRRSTHPVWEGDPQFLVDIAAPDQDAPGIAMETLGGRRLA
jgi:hypothetical protein